MSFQRCCFNCVKWFPVVFLIAIVSWSYYAYVVQLCILTITDEVTKQAIYLVLYHVLLFCFLISYYRTIFTKHNKIPREFHIPADDLIALGTSRNEDEKKRILENIGKNLPILTRSYNGVMRYCEICSSIKPDRSHHCSHCGTCILKMDHHCPWVNNCVGHSNYKFFVLFLFYAFIFCIYVALTVLEYCIKYWTSNMSTVKASSFHLMFLFIVAIAFSFSVSMLFFYHIFLTSKNRSTLESYRAPIFHIIGPNKSGFDLGWKENIKQVFGSNKFLAFLPVHTSQGDGIVYESKFNQSSYNHELLTNPNSSTVQNQKPINYVSDFAYLPNGNAMPLQNSDNPLYIRTDRLANGNNIPRSGNDSIINILD